MDEWIKKMWYIHIMKYYSAFRRKYSNTLVCEHNTCPKPGRHALVPPPFFLIAENYHYKIMAQLLTKY